MELGIRVGLIERANDVCIGSWQNYTEHSMPWIGFGFVSSMQRIGGGRHHVKKSMLSALRNLLPAIPTVFGRFPEEIEFKSAKICVDRSYEILCQKGPVPSPLYHQISPCLITVLEWPKLIHDESWLRHWYMFCIPSLHFQR